MSAPVTLTAAQARALGRIGEGPGKVLASGPTNASGPEADMWKRMSLNGLVRLIGMTTASAGSFTWRVPQYVLTAAGRAALKAEKQK